VLRQRAPRGAGNRGDGSSTSHAFACREHARAPGPEVCRRSIAPSLGRKTEPLGRLTVRPATATMCALRSGRCCGPLVPLPPRPTASAGRWPRAPVRNSWSVVVIRVERSHLPIPGVRPETCRGHAQARGRVLLPAVQAAAQ
jgi:hypothetical protein